MPSIPDPWRKIAWETVLACRCTLPGDNPATISAKAFYQYFRPNAPTVVLCPQHGEQRVVKRREIGPAVETPR